MVEKINENIINGAMLAVFMAKLGIPRHNPITPALLEKIKRDHPEMVNDVREEALRILRTPA